MVSTYDLPEQIASPQQGGWVYTRASATQNGAYAQCDDGLCFQAHRRRPSQASTSPSNWSLTGLQQRLVKAGGRLVLLVAAGGKGI
jgi:hypothetical protein